MPPDVTTSAAIDVKFTAEERCLRHVRLSIVSFVMVMTENRDLASRVAMAAAELVENAVKYTTSPTLHFRLSARISDGVSSFKLETENDASPESIQTLQRLLEEVGRGDGMNAYMRFLRAVPEKAAGASQLGLARIRYEGQMSLAAKVDGTRLRMICESIAP